MLSSHNLEKKAWSVLLMSLPPAPESILLPGRRSSEVQAFSVKPQQSKLHQKSAGTGTGPMNTTISFFFSRKQLWLLTTGVVV